MSSMLSTGALKEGMKGNVQTTKIIRACKGGETRRKEEEGAA